MTVVEYINTALEEHKLKSRAVLKVGEEVVINVLSSEEPEVWEVAANAVDKYLNEVLYARSTDKR